MPRGIWSCVVIGCVLTVVSEAANYAARATVQSANSVVSGLLRVALLSALGQARATNM